MQLSRRKTKIIPNLPDHIAKEKVYWTKKERGWVVLMAAIVLFMAILVVFQSNETAMINHRNQQAQEKIQKINENNNLLQHENQQKTNKSRLDQIAQENGMEQYTDHTVNIAPVKK